MKVYGKKVLLTGGTGFLGKQLSHAFGAAGAEVFALGIDEFDLTQRDSAERVFKKIQPEIVVHAAGFLGGIHFSRLYPGDVFLKNLQMVCHLYEMAVKYKINKLVNIGSACVYSDQLQGPFKESDMMAKPMHPSVQYYGFSKLALYLGGLAHREQHNLDSIHLVLANLYGPGDKFDPELSHVVSSMIPKFYDAAQTGKSEVVCWGTGRTVREFIYVKDCAEAILRAAEMYDEAEPLNLGVGHGITMRELAAIIAKATGFKGETIWDTTKPDGAMYKVIDSTRAHEKLKWTPPTSFEEGLTNTVNWFGEHYKDWLAKKNS